MQKFAEEYRANQQAILDMGRKLAAVEQMHVAEPTPFCTEPTFYLDVMPRQRAEEADDEFPDHSSTSRPALTRDIGFLADHDQ